jgi:DNA polymerase III delta prime subunit
MKAILEFSIPEDQEEYELCNKAQDMSYALHQIQQYLRSKVKYETDEPNKWEAYDEIYQEFYRLLEQNNIKL